MRPLAPPTVNSGWKRRVAEVRSMLPVPGCGPPSGLRSVFDHPGPGVLEVVYDPDALLATARRNGSGRTTDLSPLIRTVLGTRCTVPGT